LFGKKVVLLVLFGSQALHMYWWPIYRCVFTCTCRHFAEAQIIKGLLQKRRYTLSGTLLGKSYCTTVAHSEYVRRFAS